MGLKSLFGKKPGEDPALEQPGSRDSTVVPSQAVSIQEKPPASDLVDTVENSSTDLDADAQASGEQKGSDEDAVVYPTGLPLVIITVGLCLAVLLVALVSIFRCHL